MTAAPPPPHDPDELASALLDGELDPGAAARAERAPDTLRRVEELRAVRETLRASAAAAEPGSPSPEQREAAIARALAAFDEAADEVPRAGAGTRPAAGGGHGGADRITGWDRVQRRTGGDGDRHPARGENGARTGGRRIRRAAWLGIAASVLAALGVAALLSGRPDDQQVADAPSDTAESTMTAEAGRGDGDAAANEVDDDDHGALRDPAPGSAEVAGDDTTAAPIDLGVLGTPDELVRHAATSARNAGLAPGTRPDDPVRDAVGVAEGHLLAPEACDDARAAEAGPLRTGPVVAMTGMLGSSRVSVWVYSGAEGYHVIAIDESCRVAVHRTTPA